MSNSKPNYWSYRIYRQGFDGQPQFVAAYLAETDRGSLDTDIASADSRLRRYLERFFHIDAKKYVEEHQLRAQALLGGLVANDHCALLTWVDVAPPPAKAVPPPEKLDAPTHTEGRVRIWLQERGAVQEG